MAKQMNATSTTITKMVINFFVFGSAINQK